MDSNNVCHIKLAGNAFTFRMQTNNMIELNIKYEYISYHITFSMLNRVVVVIIMWREREWKRVFVHKLACITIAIVNSIWSFVWYSSSQRLILKRKTIPRPRVWSYDWQPATAMLSLETNKQTKRILRKQPQRVNVSTEVSRLNQGRKRFPPHFLWK